MTKKDLSKLEEYALSGEDLVRLVGNIEILSYPDLDEYTDLDDLFKKRDQVVVLFLTESKDFGHWLAMLLHRHKNTVEIFDSYGMTVDSHRTWLSPSKLKSLDQIAPQMKDLINKSNYHAVYNDTCVQADGKNTCGRHVASRILYKDMLLPAYIKMLVDSGDPDEFVTLLTFKKLGK